MKHCTCTPRCPPLEILPPPYPLSLYLSPSLSLLSFCRWNIVVDIYFFFFFCIVHILHDYIYTWSISIFLPSCSFYAFTSWSFGRSQPLFLSSTYILCCVLWVRVCVCVQSFLFLSSWSTPHLFNIWTHTHNRPNPYPFLTLYVGCVCVCLCVCTNDDLTWLSDWVTEWMTDWLGEWLTCRYGLF